MFMSKYYIVALFTLAIFTYGFMYLFAEPELETILNRTYGGMSPDAAYSAVETDDGFLIVGRTMSYGAGDWDVWLLKIDQDGTPLWNKTYGTAAAEEGLYIIKADGDNYIIAGRTNIARGNDQDLLLLKVDSKGNMLWNRTMGGLGDDWMWEIEKTGDNGYVLVGRTNSYGAGLNDCWLIKIDENGEALWNVTLGGAGDDRGRSLLVMDNGGLLMMGFSNSYGHGGFDFWLVGVDPNGDAQWNKSYGGAGADRGFGVAPTIDGYVLSGSTNSFSEGGSLAYFMGIDSELNMIWNRTYGGESIDSFHHILKTRNGGYVLVGYTDSLGEGGRDIFIAITDGEGNPLLEKTYGGPEFDAPNFGFTTQTGDYLIGGSATNNGNEDLLILKLRVAQPSQTPEPSPESSQTPEPSPESSQTPEPSPESSQGIPGFPAESILLGLATITLLFIAKKSLKLPQ